jgi:regulator of protease activity HflC (stomatin/prohibitin superfamily)
MARHDTLIIKDTHRGLLYEDGVFRDLLPAGRYQIPRAPSPLAAFFGSRGPRVEVIMVDVRGRDRTVVIQDLLTADGATISASFVVQFRVADPLAAIHRVKNFEERLYSEAQTAARRVLRGLSVEEILGSRDEVGEEMLIQVREAVEPAGLEVTGLDFKDLIVPDDLRKIMNRAVIARRLRQSQMVDGLAIDDDELALHDEPAVEDDSGLIIAKASFAKAKEADEEPEGLAFRQPAREPRGEGTFASGFESSLLRCRP